MAVIDVHAHYTRVPNSLDAYRGRQLVSRQRPKKGRSPVTDDEIRDTLGPILAQLDERGIDHMMWSPRAGFMGHDFGDELISKYWTEINNDIVGLIASWHPTRFTPVCQLPQSPGAGLDNCIAELRRCHAMGFVGCVLNPDPSGGVAPLAEPLGTRWWYPLWEVLQELEMPALVHASSTCVPFLDMNASHYINTDITTVVELCNNPQVFDDFPGLRLIIPHGGGSIPYQFNRHRAIHALSGRPRFDEVVRNLYFDTAIYDADSMEMLVRKVGADNILYSCEMFGSAQGVDPDTGRVFDDTLDMVREIPGISDDDLHKILEGNARRLFKIPDAIGSSSTRQTEGANA
jgi:4-oxalmesaconate hydratase